MDATKKDYSTKWTKMKVLSLGGRWGYAIGIIKDAQDTYKIRIVKGKLSHPFPKGPNWKDVDLTATPNPIRQVQKMNFKQLEEFTGMVPIVQEMFKALNSKKED